MPVDPYIIALIIAVGLAVGSFLNVLIYRLPRNKPIVFSRSICPTCAAPIRFYHNIPIVSFLLLRGKCASCRAAISWRYPLVELLNAGLYFLFCLMDGWSVGLAAHCFLSSALLAVFFIDLDFQIIPDVITLPGMAAGLLFSLALDPPGILGAVLGLLVGGLGLLMVAYLGEWLFKKDAMGGGDIKMAAMMGAFVGWQKVVLIFLMAAGIGTVVSIIWMIASPKIRKERLIPFGPFLASAAVITLVYGDQLIRYYINTMVAR